MKRFVFFAVTVMVVVAAVSTISAEEVKSVKKDYTVNVGESEAMAGTVGLIQFSSPNPKITLANDKGENIEFTVKPSCTIFNSSDGSLLSLRDMNSGDKVVVNYRISPKGVYEAIAIKMTK
jgi:hypothetical protein